MVELQGQPQDPNAVFLQAAAEEAQAKAAKARADVLNTVAQAELNQAKTVETLAKVGGEAAGEAVAAATSPGPMAAMPEPDEKRLLEIEALRLENDMRRLKMAETATQVERGMGEREAATSMMQASQQMQEAVVQAVEGLGQTVAVIGDAVGKMSEAVGQFTDTSRENTEKALQAITKPKRVIREKGRVVGIE